MPTDYGLGDLDETSSDRTAPVDPKDPPMTEEGQPDGTGQTISIPADMLQGAKVKQGDQLPFTVVSVNEDGSIEAAYKPPESGSMNEEIDKAETSED